MTKEDVRQWFTPFLMAVWGPIKEKEELLELDHSFYRTPELLGAEVEDETLRKFYSFFEWWRLSWTSKENPKAQGAFNFRCLPEVLQNWDESFGGHDWAPEMKGFKVFDDFADAGAVGFFENRMSDGLFLAKYDGEAEPLMVDFEGYLKLLTLSKGFLWWPNALIELRTGHAQPNVERFRTEMPKVFPDFDYGAFEALFEEVRLDR